MRRLPWLTLLALTACTTTGPAVVTPSKKPVATTASARPAPAPVLPARVHLPLPASLGAYMTPEAAKIVAQGGGNIISNDGASYGLLDCAPVTTNAKDFFTDILGLAIRPYSEAVLIVNGVLAKAQGLPLDATKVITDPRGAGGKLTMKLSAGLLEVAEGEVYLPANQILAVSFESATKGKAVYRSPALHPTLGHLAIATKFDLVAGTVSADGLADPTVLPNASDPFLYRAHWDFSAPPDPIPGAETFSMRLAAYLSQKDDPCNSGARGVSANFLAGGQGAVRMGRVLPGEKGLSFTRNDGKGYDPTANAADDFFINADGKPLKTPTPALTAVVPGADEFNVNFPPDPSVGLPFADPIFAF
jgi:hypothetical protein